jgi:hypothetical protein
MQICHSLVLRSAVLCAIAVLFIARPATAQTGSSPLAPKLWEAEIYGGLMSGTGPIDGTGQLPPAGAVYTPTVAGFPPTRLIPSWFFGDGALLFNQVRAGLPPQSQYPAIVPLDNALQNSAARRKSGAVFGVRLGRRLTDRFGAEFTLDVGRGSVTFVDEVRPAAEATMNSIESAFSGAFGPQQTITTSISMVDEVGHELLAAGALRIALVRGKAAEPYVVVGGGVASAMGDSPSMELVRSLRLQFGASSFYEELDAVTVTTHASLGGLLVFGGGLRQSIGRHSGVRIDARVFVISGKTSTRVVARPTTFPGTTAAATFRASEGVGIIFSSASVVTSSLSVPLDEFETFTGTGFRTQVSATVGYYVRF